MRLGITIRYGAGINTVTAPGSTGPVTFDLNQMAPAERKKLRRLTVAAFKKEQGE